MTPQDYVEVWSRATDHLRAAISHRFEMKGESGEAAAEADYGKALTAYNEATRQMLDILDA